MAPVMWGTTYAVTTQLLPAGRPMLIATVRALIAGLALLAFTRRLPSGQWWWRSAILGALNIGGFFALLFIAASRLPGGLAAVLASCQPVLVLTLAPAMLGQTVRRSQMLYALIGVGGIALLVLRAADHPDLLGMSAALGAAASSALGLVLTRRWQTPVGVWTMTAWQLSAGGIVLLPILLSTEGLPHQLTWHAAAGFAWLIGPSIIGGYYLWFAGLTRLPAATVSALGMLSPITAGALGWIWLHQSLSPLQLAGAAVTLGSLLLLQTRPRPRSAPVANVETVPTPTSDASTCSKAFSKSPAVCAVPCSPA